VGVLSFGSNTTVKVELITSVVPFDVGCAGRWYGRGWVVGGLKFFALCVCSVDGCGGLFGVMFLDIFAL